jgi:hypothetical protein
MSKKQLKGDDSRAKHVVDADIDETTLKKMKAAKRGVKLCGGSFSAGSFKGGSFQGGSFKGGDVFSDISKGVNKASKAMSDGITGATKSLSSKAKSASKSVSKLASSGVKAALKSDIGGKVESIKQVIPESTTKSAVKLALLATGMDEDSADLAAGASVGALYNTDFSKPPLAEDMATGAIKGGMKSSASSSSSSKTVDGGALNSVQRRLTNGRKQEANDLERRKHASKRPNYNGETVQSHTMVRQAPPKISGGGMGDSDSECEYCTGGRRRISRGGALEMSTMPVSMVSKPVAVKKSTSLGGGRPKAGSQEAKDKMAALRAKRGSKGGSFKAEGCSFKGGSFKGSGKKVSEQMAKIAEMRKRKQGGKITFN